MRANLRTFLAKLDSATYIKFTLLVEIFIPVKFENFWRKSNFPVCDIRFIKMLLVEYFIDKLRHLIILAIDDLTIELTPILVCYGR